MLISLIIHLPLKSFKLAGIKKLMVKSLLLTIKGKIRENSNHIQNKISPLPIKTILKMLIETNIKENSRENAKKDMMTERGKRLNRKRKMKELK